MRYRQSRLAAVVIPWFLTLGITFQVGAQAPTTKPDQLGQVNFPVSCSAEAQANFHRAMALYHSFDWKRGKAAFEAIARLDPRCGMAYWGLAIVAANNPFGWPVYLKLQEGTEAIQKANDVGAATPRERAYIAALATLYEAINAFARALGAARNGDTASVRREIERLHNLRMVLTERKLAYWAEQVEIQAKVATAWALHAEGKPDEALAAMRAAADHEDQTEKHVVTPGPIMPARELLGDLLMELGRPGDALPQYEASIAKEPNRFRGLYGAGLAAERAGDRARAKRHFEKLMAIAGQSDGTRVELAHAIQVLSQQ
jgi:tetratricopeptide (TPR) repeat protein